MLKRSRKLIALFIVASMLVFSGCGDDTDSNISSNTTGGNGQDEKIVLTMWHYYNGSTKDHIDQLIKEFNESVGVQKNISVDAYSYSSVNDLAVAVLAAANQEVGVDELPDIFAAYSDTTLTLDNLGVVAALDSYFTDTELALYQQDFLNEGRFDEEGNLKILPVAKSTELLFLNETDFQIFAEEIGIEKEEMSTWEGLAKVAEAYYTWTDAQTEELYDGSALFGVDSTANFMLIAAKQVGDEMYDYDDTGVSFGLSEEGAKKIWDNFCVPYIKGYYTRFGSFRSDDVKSGDILAYVGSTSSVNYFPSLVERGRDDGYTIVGGTMSYPYYEGMEKIAVQQGAGMVVAKSDEVREAAAVEFLKWFTSTGYNVDFAVSTGYIPVQSESVTYDNVVSVMEENAEDEIRDVVLSSVDTTYNYAMKEYEFYANKPFDGSYEARTTIASYVENYLVQAREEISLQMEAGVEREDIILALTSDESFKQWYETLKANVSEVLSKY